MKFFNLRAVGNKIIDVFNSKYDILLNKIAYKSKAYKQLYNEYNSFLILNKHLTEINYTLHNTKTVNLLLQKLPGGLTAIIEKCRECGMNFGLWFEPEMVSEDSQLFRAIPTGILQHRILRRAKVVINGCWISSNPFGSIPIISKISFVVSSRLFSKLVLISFFSIVQFKAFRISSPFVTIVAPSLSSL